MTMKIAICDDEETFGMLIREILERFMTTKGYSCEIKNFISGKQFLEQKEKVEEYQVIFLDICMEEIDGLEVAGRIRNLTKKPYLVFVTAFLDFATIGYRYQAFRYILKNTKQLQEAIEECMEAILQDNQMNLAEKTFEFVEGRKSISLDQICYLESRAHKVYFNMIDRKEPYTVYDSLDQLTKEMESYGFLRVHRSYLVNLKYIKSYRRFELFLMDGTRISIPKERYKLVKQEIERYKGERKDG